MAADLFFQTISGQSGALAAEPAAAICSVSGDSLQDKYMGGEEKQELARIVSAVRRHEWTAARIALKILLLEHGLIASPLEARIKKDAAGRPHLEIPAGDRRGHKRLPCSIAHKLELAAVCFARQDSVRLGIDVEKVSTRPLRLSKAFMNRQDRVSDPFTDREAATALWSCKEAAAKVLGLGLLLDFKELKAEIGPAGQVRVTADGCDPISGYYLRLGGFILTVCCSSEE